MRPLSWDTATALQLDFSGQLEGPHSEITEVSYSQTLQQLLAHRSAPFLRIIISTELRYDQLCWGGVLFTALLVTYM